MQMRMTFLPAEHTDSAPGSSVATETFDPNAGVITTELNTTLYNKHLNEMGEQGWQLLSVQAMHRVEYTHIQNVSVIGGFYFFWQKSNANEGLAFPMTSPSFPGIQPAHYQTSTTTATPKSQEQATRLVNDATANAESNNKMALESIENNEVSSQPTQNTHLESRISSIKRLLEEKSSKNTQTKKPSIEIPPEANTQLLRDIEDIHNLRRDRSDETKRSSTSNTKPDPKINDRTGSKANNGLKNKIETRQEIQLESNTDADFDIDLDFDLDLDLDFDDMERTERVPPE